MDVPPVLDTTVVQVEPPSADLSIMYPVIVEPPSFVGAVHDRLTCEDDIAVAVNPVGGDDTTTGGAMVVADTILDGELVPTEFMADTR